jgi:outer membrane protein OmpA-like peptidoglycan-associated protein
MDDSEKFGLDDFPSFLSRWSFGFIQTNRCLMILRSLATATLLTLAIGAMPAQAAFSSQDVVGSKFDSKVQTKTGACVRTRWMGGDDVCGVKAPPPPPAPAPYIAPPMPKPVVQAPPPPPPPMPKTIIKKEARTIYFNSGKNDVSAGGERKLDQLAETLKGAKDIQRVEIVGYADVMGKKSANYSLSERRAKAVEAYLNNRGYVNTSLAKTRSVGSDEATTVCEGKMKRDKKIDCHATDRKVEVEVVYAIQE